MADQTIVISNAQQDELQAAFDNIQPMGAVDTFCQNWPSAKIALETLRPLLAMIPGINVFAGSAIAVVIAAGDAAHKSSLCK